MLASPSHVADGDRGGVLQPDGIRALGLAIAVEHQRQEGPEFDTVPIRRLHFEKIIH